MSDYIVRATAADSNIRAFAITSKQMVEDARRHHNTSPVMTAALGRLLSAGAMMGTMMKGEKDLLTLQIQCSGPAKGLTVTADTNGNVNLICNECYEVKKIDYVKYTVYEGENKYRSAGTFKVDKTAGIEWKRDGDKDDVVRYILNLPLTEITNNEEDYYYIELELYIGNPDNNGTVAGRVSGYCKIKKTE